MPQQLHQALIQNSYQKDTPQDQLVGHVTRGSTAIEVRERFPNQTEQGAACQKKQAHKKTTRNNKHRVPKQLTPKPIAKPKRGRLKEIGERLIRSTPNPPSAVRRWKKCCRSCRARAVSEPKPAAKVISIWARRKLPKATSVRGATKVMVHLMIGILALTLNYWLRLAG